MPTAKTHMASNVQVVLLLRQVGARCGRSSSSSLSTTGGACSGVWAEATAADSSSGMLVDCSSIGVDISRLGWCPVVPSSSPTTLLTNFDDRSIDRFPSSQHRGQEWPESEGCCQGGRDGNADRLSPPPFPPYTRQGGQTQS